VLDVPADTQYTLVEGQGSILNPAFAAVTYGLMFGSAPDLLVLCHEAGRDAVEDFDVPIPPLADLARLYESALAPLKPAACVAIALNTRALGEREAREYVEGIEKQTGLPADDVVRFGPGKLWRAVRAAAEKTLKRQIPRQAARR
jgi:uncharacterized NAD-dependent epimerase/dehydratase family protein